MKSIRKRWKRRKDKSRHSIDTDEVLSESKLDESEGSSTATPTVSLVEENNQTTEGILKNAFRNVTSVVKPTEDGVKTESASTGVKVDSGDSDQVGTSSHRDLESIDETPTHILNGAAMQEDQEKEAEISLASELGPKAQRRESVRFQEEVEVRTIVPEKKEEEAEIVENKVEEEEKVYDIQGNTVLLILIGLCGLFWVFVSWIFGFRVWELLKYFFVFGGGSLASVYLYSRNRRKKEFRNNVMSMTPGVRGLAELMKESPTWLSFTETEKVEWFNKVLGQMWPSYDKAVCDAIKESVEPIMQSVKPPVFKDIKFRKLRFGKVPFRVEGVEIEHTETEVILKLDIRWSSDASVSLAIEPNLPNMNDAATMCPKVTDLSCHGTLQLAFKPLVDEMPGFGAIIASFTKTPSIRFHCDFGKALGGNVSGRLVKNALDPFIKDTLVNMFVWPQRFVIPIIYDESITGPLEDLELRHVGILTVDVIEGRDFPAADMNKSSDPFIELWTRPERKYNTAVVKKTLHPVWEKEVHHMLIQEPRSQNLHVTAYDVDMLNVSEMFKSVNIIKNMKESFNAKELLGRALIPLRSVTESPKRVTDEVYDLGKGGFGDVNGPGRGCGTLRLRLLYTPFSMLKFETSTVGIVLVNVIRCRDLVPMDSGGTSDPYVKVKIGEQTNKTQVINACCDPEFFAKFEFFDVSIKETIELTVFDRDVLSRDDFIGGLEIPVHELAASKTHELSGQIRKWFPLKNIEHGEIQVNLQYIPMDTLTHNCI